MHLHATVGKRDRCRCARRGGNQVGIAFYDPSKRDLCVCEAHDGVNGSFDFLSLAIAHAQPSSVHLPSGAGDAMVEAAKNAMNESGMHCVEAMEDSADQDGSACDDDACRRAGVVLEKRSIFAPAEARSMLESLVVAGSDESMNSSSVSGLSRLSTLSTMMCFEREQQVIAAGAILKVLMRTGTLAHAEQSANSEANGHDAHDAHMQPSLTLAMHNVREISLDHCLTLDGSTQEALSIFHSERHPSFFVGREKEGLSVFGTLNRCHTVQGKRLLCSWIARPILDVRTLEERFDGIEYFKQRQHTVQALRHCVKGAKDMDLLLKKLGSTGELHTIAVWRDFIDTLSAYLSARDCVETQMKQDGSASVAKRVGGLRRLLSCVNSSILEIYDTVTHVVDLGSGGISEDGGSSAGGQLVQRGISDELDEKRKLYDELDDFLTEIARAELQRIPQALARDSSNLTLGIVYQVRC